jgi:2-dehydropantoate 2-reductase
MHVAVVGGGSLGLLYAARLASVCRVAVITRTENQAAALRERGITYVTLKQERRVVPVEAYSFDGAAMPEFDLFLITVKQSHIKGLLPIIKIWLQRVQPLIVMMQNGLGHLEAVHEYTGYERIWAAVTTEGARRNGLTEVAHTGGGHIWLGSVFTPIDPLQPVIAHFLQALTTAGISCEVTAEIEKKIWDKLIVNCLINPLTALLEVPNGGLLELPHTLELMKQLADECMAVAEAAGVSIDPRIYERVLEICRLTARNHSSMLQDISAKRGTEIGWLNGALVRVAEEKGVAVPRNRLLWQLIEAKEGKYRNG